MENNLLYYTQFSASDAFKNLKNLEYHPSNLRLEDPQDQVSEENAFPLQSQFHKLLKKPTRREVDEHLRRFSIRPVATQFRRSRKFPIVAPRIIHGQRFILDTIQRTTFRGPSVCKGVSYRGALQASRSWRVEQNAPKLLRIF